MKKSLYTLLLLLAGELVFVSNGCKDDDPVSTEDKSIPSDIFPLAAGHRFEYSGYFTYQNTDSVLSATASFYSTSWTILSVDTPLANVYGPLAAVIASKQNGKANSALILDLTLVTPPSTFKPTPIAAYYDAASEDYFYLTNLGYFFRVSQIKDSANASGVRRDSLRFIKLASPKAGIGGEFTCFEENFTGYSNPTAATPLKLTIKGKWEGKQDITVNGQTFSTYYLVVTRVVMAGTVEADRGTTARLWLAKGIGPVKMHLYGDAETPGNYRELKTKNF